ncbi:hypothetical protein [Winogradskyella haliclonae]|uniref:Cytochrome c domain-containing protein n=1 Tax=Winogradskyella haliclonae TaxID=2048558 RepID=A0ABQ2BX49_9FLAO|nr:hypothetical protein [Winogradskyella haliclonae]GGI56420.1 hypothetical protein GCM10011444_07290 [Winogradskyella haliclonae]
MKTVRLIFLMVFALSIFACASDSEDDFVDSGNDIESPDDGDGDGDGGGQQASTINYTDDIAPIMSAACVNCHGAPPTNGAPFALVNFTQVSQRANGIFNRMNLSSGAPGAMPPSGRLPQSTIDLIQQWIDDGKPEN